MKCVGFGSSGKKMLTTHRKWYMHDWECMDVKNCTVYLNEVVGWVLVHIGPSLL